MRWKWIFAGLILAGFAAAGCFGWMKYDALRRQKETVQKLALCRNWIQMGEDAKAQPILEEILAQNPRIEGADAIWATLARSYEKTAQPDKALVCWERIRKQFPQSPEIPVALAALAANHFDQGRLEDAEKLWDILIQNYPDTDGAASAQFGRVRLAIQRDGEKAARGALEEFLAQHPDSPHRPEVEEILGRLNMNLLLSAELDEAAGDAIYAIKKGDTLYGIGKREKISPDLLMRVNNITNAANLTIGRRLKIPRVDFSIEVDKSDNTLTLFNHGRFFKRYRVRTGKDDWRTPVGQFRVTRKVKDPPWNTPEKTYGPGEAGNELGTRWMAFEGSMLGIHGTLDPSTIGTYASNGCIGMLTEDVEELFDLVPVGTPVKITGKINESALQKE